LGADVETGLRPGLEDAAIFQYRVRLNDRGNTDITLQSHPAHGRESVSGPQGSLLDEILNFTG
jgi:hypothetical protein